MHKPKYTYKKKYVVYEDGKVLDILPNKKSAELCVKVMTNVITKGLPIPV